MDLRQEDQERIKFNCHSCLIVLPDDGQTTPTLTGILTEKGFKPLQVQNPGETLIYCRQIKFAFIVITDDDPQLIKSMRSMDGLNSHTPVIAVSTSEILPESTLDLLDRRLIQEIVLKMDDGEKFSREVVSAVERVMHNKSDTDFGGSLSPVSKTEDAEPQFVADSLPRETQKPQQTMAEPVRTVCPSIFPWFLPQGINPIPFVPFGAVTFPGNFQKENGPLCPGGVHGVGGSEGNLTSYPTLNFPPSVHQAFNNLFLPVPQLGYNHFQPMSPITPQKSYQCSVNTGRSVDHSANDNKAFFSGESLTNNSLKTDESTEVKQHNGSDTSVKQCILPGIEQLLRPISPRQDKAPPSASDISEQIPQKTPRNKAPRCTLRDSVIRQQAAMEFPDVTMNPSDELDYNKCPFSVLRRPYFETFEETDQGMKTIADPNLSPADRHNAKERHRRLRIVKAAEFFKRTLPCMEETMDKATAIELASYFVLVMRNAFNKRNPSIVPTLHKTFKEEWQKVFEMEHVVQV